MDTEVCTKIFLSAPSLIRAMMPSVSLLTEKLVEPRFDGDAWKTV
jgi:hypothetical protein